MPYSEALDLYVWEIAVLLGKADVQEPDEPNSEIDAMLRAMNPRPPSSERKG